MFTHLFSAIFGDYNRIYRWIRGPPCRCMLCITVSLGPLLFRAAKFPWDSTGSHQKKNHKGFKLGCLKMDILDHFGKNKIPESWSPFIKMQRESCNSPIVQWKIILIPTCVHRFACVFWGKFFLAPESWKKTKLLQLMWFLVGGWTNPPEK